MIFETEHLLVRKLFSKDLEGFYQLESNLKVLKYADGKVKNRKECKVELNELVEKYQQKENNFLIYAVQRKSDAKFIGTIALVHEKKVAEIGYRFIEDFWGLGYGKEVVKGLVTYCKSLGLQNLVSFVVDKNRASVKILEKLQFKKVATYMNEEISSLETKYELEL